MQDYDEIRKRFLNGESQRHIAKTMGISRNTVKKYCEGNAVPWERKTPERISSVLTEDITQFILSCLNAFGGLQQTILRKRSIMERLLITNLFVHNPPLF